MKILESARGHGRDALVALLCVALVFWSLAPTVPHADKIFMAFQDHPETAAEHGHSLAFEVDLDRIFHGHSHEVFDHEHGQALLITSSGTGGRLAFRDGWRMLLTALDENKVFRIERPPRA